jgi:hypothetical protein
MSIGAVNYADVFETSEGVVSPEEEISRENGYTAHITFQCDWDDRIQLCIDKLTANGGLGETYPHNILNNARAYSAKCRPAPGAMAGVITGSGGLAEYQHAHVTVTYKTPGRHTDQQPETTYGINETIEGHAEFQTLPYQNFQWPDGTALTAEEAPGRLLRGIDYCVTIQSVPNIPPAIQTLPGCCNMNPICSPTLGITFNAQTLLFSDPTLTRKYDIATGTGTWTVGYRFHQCPQPAGGSQVTWNMFPRAVNMDYEAIQIKTSGGGDAQQFYMYPPADFSQVLPFAM